MECYEATRRSQRKRGGGRRRRRRQRPRLRRQRRRQGMAAMMAICIFTSSSENVFTLQSSIRTATSITAASKRTPATASMLLRRNSPHRVRSSHGYPIGFLNASLAKTNHGVGNTPNRLYRIRSACWIDTSFRVLPDSPMDPPRALPRRHDIVARAAAWKPVWTADFVLLEIVRAWMFLS